MSANNMSISVLSFTCDIFAEQYDTSEWEYEAERTKNYEATCFLKTGLSRHCPLCRVTRWSLMLRAHKGGPWGPPILTPSPLLIPKLELWMGKGISSLPLACCGDHFPPSRSPLPSCSGQCPNASTSHLGLAKPVPTVGGQAWHAAPRALTPDGNTMAQGLAGWLG